MKKQLALLLVSVFVLGLAAAGCGGDDESSSGGGDDSGAESDFGGGVTDPSDASGGGTDPSDASVEQAVQGCESTVPQGPEISEEVKSDILAMCVASAEGDQEAVLEAAKDMCEGLSEESAGAAQNEALSSVCNSAPVAP